MDIDVVGRNGKEYLCFVEFRTADTRIISSIYSTRRFFFAWSGDCPCTKLLMAEITALFLSSVKTGSLYRPLQSRIWGILQERYS